MAAQRELLHPLEQDREPVSGPEHGEERVQSGLRRPLPQQPLGHLLVGDDPELLVRSVEQTLRALTQARARCPRAGDHEHALGALSGGGERSQADRQRLAASRAGGAEDEQRTLAVLDDPALTRRRHARINPRVGAGGGVAFHFPTR
jgi:hypothetical protein